MFDLDKQIEVAKKELEDAEDELATLGFPVDQWMLIKRYIGASILHNQFVQLQAIGNSFGFVDEKTTS